jgi:hypothetical protein
MTTDTKTYSIDKSSFDQYIRSTTKNWTITALIVLCIVLTFEAFIIYNLDTEFPFWVLLFATALIFGAIYLGQKMWTSTLKKFQNAVYELTPRSLIIKRDDIKPREIKLSDIVVFNKTKKGTVLVTGNGWTKLDYYRPKISGNSLDQDDRIFIPSVTDNYAELILEIKKTAANRVDGPARTY